MKKYFIRGFDELIPLPDRVDSMESAEGYVEHAYANCGVIEVVERTYLEHSNISMLVNTTYEEDHDD